MFSWTLHQKGLPNKCDYAAVAVRHELYYFGLNTDKNKYQIDMHVFNTLTFLWRKLAPVTPGRGEPHLEIPSRRWGYTAVLIEDITYFWGGNEYLMYCNLLHAFDVDAHRWYKPQVSGRVPEGRSYHSACVLGKGMYIHGGLMQTGLTNDMYKLDTTTMVWSLINTRGTPPVSYHHSATIIGTKMFVFGGSDKTFRVFDTETNLWLSTPSVQLLPEDRWSHSACTYNGDLYIFGGFKYNQDRKLIFQYQAYKYQDYNDLWKFSPETFSWKKVEPKGKGPSPTSRMCCCMVGDRIILFGRDATPNDLYVLDFNPSLKTLCKLAVIQYGLEQSELPHNIRWELAAMSTNSS